MQKIKGIEKKPTIYPAADHISDVPTQQGLNPTYSAGF